VFGTDSRTSLDGNGPWSCHAEDIDGDGYDDLVVPGYHDNSDHITTTYVYWGSEDGLSNADRLALPSQGHRPTGIADLDQDGFVDLVMGNYYGSNSYSVDSWIYGGSGSGWSAGDRTGLPTHGNS